jgi:hypothetical protein
LVNHPKYFTSLGAIFCAWVRAGSPNSCGKKSVKGFSSMQGFRNAVHWVSGVDVADAFTREGDSGHEDVVTFMMALDSISAEWSKVGKKTKKPTTLDLTRLAPLNPALAELVKKDQDPRWVGRQLKKLCGVPVNGRMIRTSRDGFGTVWWVEEFTARAA